MSVPPTDPQRRLLDAIAARLPLERVHELYLFSPMRQGGVETGIAVVAAGEPPAPPDAPAVGDDLVADVLSPGTIEGDVQTPALVRAVMDAAEAAAEAGDEAEPGEVADDPTEAAEIAADALALADAERERVDGRAERADVAEEPAADGPDDGGEADGTAGDADEALAAPAPPPAVRFTVYTARYRLQLKGPDRGKWEADVVEEADAPLLTVDAVVRGVQRRIGDAAEVERLTGEDVRRLLAGPA